MCRIRAGQLRLSGLKQAFESLYSYIRMQTPRKHPDVEHISVFCFTEAAGVGTVTESNLVCRFRLGCGNGKLAFLLLATALVKGRITESTCLIQPRFLCCVVVLRFRAGAAARRGFPRRKTITWLILPVVICLSQRLSHACLRISFFMANLRMAH